MTKAERTRNLIIEKTAPVFNCQGYDGTSLADLTQATGLTKGAIYGNFADKQELASAAFKYAIEKVRNQIQTELGKQLTPKAQLLALFNFYASYVLDPPVQGGCPLLNQAVEVDDHRGTMRRVVVKELMATVNFIKRLLERGIAAGEFQEDIECDRLAYVFFCSIEGAIMFARAGKSREPMHIIIQHCKDIVNRISK